VPANAVGTPRVSICIPAYNDAAVIGDALRSVLRQEYASLEILVLDNHSTDETGQVVAEIAAGDSRVHYRLGDENIGMARNFNACIATATGEYVQILCSDDVLEPGSVNRLARALLDHPGAVLAAGGRIFTDHALRRKEVVVPSPRLREVASDMLIRECFARGNLIGEPSAVMFRRSAAGRGFNADYSQAVDLEMWFHLLGQGSAVLLPEALCQIRQHGEQVTQANIKSGRIVEDKRLLFRQYADYIVPSLCIWQKFNWDARMASSVVRCTESGGSVGANGITEVFFPKTFLQLLLPLAGAAWKLRGISGSHRL
jgi:glycosyltransferase involved in cell wall biosynthesis